jgi:ketosteroid isomerase-like protein
MTDSMAMCAWGRVIQACIVVGSVIYIDRVSRNSDAIRELFGGVEQGARALGWSEENPSAVRTEATARMFADVLGRFLDPEVEYVEDPAWPGAEIFRGRDSVRERFREYWETVAFQPPELRELIETPRGVIIVYCVEGIGTGSGTPFHQEIAWIADMSEGLMRRIEVHFDPAEALRQVGRARTR